MNIIGSIGHLVNGNGNGNGIRDQAKADIINPEGFTLESIDAIARPDWTYPHIISDVILGRGSYQETVKPANISLLIQQPNLQSFGAYFGVITVGLGLVAFVSQLNMNLYCKKSKERMSIHS